jgi:hypothetical protein
VKTVCIHSAESLTVLFLTMFAISIVGMIMVMLRAAMYPYRETGSFPTECAGGYDKDSSSTKASVHDASIEPIFHSESATRVMSTNLLARSFSDRFRAK